MARPTQEQREWMAQGVEAFLASDPGYGHVGCLSTVAADGKAFARDLRDGTQPRATREETLREMGVEPGVTPTDFTQEA